VPGEQYDVFVSYHSKDPVGFWVREFFVVELKNWLDQQFPDREASLSWDRETIEVGDEIEQKIITALSATTIFVPVLSPSYFNQSRWCKWEWQCFQTWRPNAMMPVLFYNIHSLPPEVQAIRMADFTKANSSFPGWRNSESYGSFQSMVREFAQQVARRIKATTPPNGFPPDFEPPPLPPPAGTPPIGQRRMSS
jgi:hypothetical protein